MFSSFHIVNSENDKK